MDTLRSITQTKNIEETMANPNTPMPMILDGQQGDGAQVPGAPGLPALPPVPVLGGDVGQAEGSFGPAERKKPKRNGAIRSASASPSSHGRMQALTNETALPLQYATKGPTGGASSSENPTVGFAVKKKFTEVRMDLLEAQNKLSEYEALIRNEASQLHQTSQAQRQNEQEIFQLREQLRQQTELAGAHLENQRIVNTAESHMLQQASTLAKNGISERCC